MLQQDRAATPVDSPRPTHLFAMCAGQDQVNWAATELELMPSVLFAEGMIWGRCRRIVAPSLNAQNVVDMLPTMAAVRHERATERRKLGI